MRLSGLAGRVAVVTGAASGIGRAIVHRLAREEVRLGERDADAVLDFVRHTSLDGLQFFLCGDHLGRELLLGLGNGVELPAQ